MLIDEFKNHLNFERQLTKNTILAYGRDVKQFADFCTRHNKGLAEASPELLDNFVYSLKTEKTLAPASVFRKIEAVRCFYKFMLVEGLIKEDPTKFLYSPRLIQKGPSQLSQEDMETIKGLDTGDSLFFNHQDPNMVEWFDNMTKVRREQQDITKEKKNWE